LYIQNYTTSSDCFSFVITGTFGNPIVELSITGEESGHSSRDSDCPILNIDCGVEREVHQVDNVLGAPSMEGQVIKHQTISLARDLFEVVDVADEQGESKMVKRKVGLSGSWGPE